MMAVPIAASAARKNQRRWSATRINPVSRMAIYPKRPGRLSWPVVSSMGVRKPPSIPRMATTKAFNRTASRKAVTVMSTIMRKVGTGPKNSNL